MTGAAPRKPIGTAEATQRSSPHEKNIKLVRAMGGTKGYNPMPLDQHAWLMELGQNYPPLMMLWAWMCDKTIQVGHRSPYAVDERGRELRILDAVRDLKTDAGNLRRAWKVGELKGLWRRGTKDEGKRRLYLCGDVQTSEAAMKEARELYLLPEDQGEEKAKKVCTNTFPPYLANQIKKLRATERKQFLTEHQRDLEARNRAIADVTEAVRVIFEQRENSRFEQYKLRKIREQKTSAARLAEREARQKRISKILPPVSEFVQTFFAFEAKTSSTRFKTGVVQTSASLLTSETHREESQASSSVMDPETPRTTTTARSPISELAERMNWEPDAARQLVEACRAKEPTITTAEILKLAGLKQRQIAKQIQSGKIQNIVGFFISAVPKMIHTPDHDLVKREIARFGADQEMAVGQG
jgi:hypothetical protein